MFENLSLFELQQYWWMIISLLGGVLVFLLFVQGGQSLIYSLGKKDEHRTLILNSIGKKWEFTFTTLVTFGGAFFASFPLFYATSFGGAYWAWITLLFCFVIQAVSYTFRSKENNFLGKKTYDAFLFINGLLSPILIGVVVGSFFTGSGFSLTENNAVKWDSSFRGLELLLDAQNVILGLVILFLSRTLACLYFKNNIESKGLLSKVNRSLLINSGAFVGILLYWIVMLILSDGYGVKSDGIIFIQAHKYLQNILELPLYTAVLLSGLCLILTGIFISIKKPNYTKGIWYSGTGTILLIFSVFILSGFNNTSFYPSTTDIQSSLTIQNASSSHFTLKTMSYISLLIPFVVAYIWYAWKAINKERVSSKSLEKGYKY